MSDNVLVSSTDVRFASGIGFVKVGNLYIADYCNNRIQIVDKNTGLIITVVGEGTQAFNEGYIPAASHYLIITADIAVDAS